MNRKENLKKGKRFTSQNQPSGEAKSRGKRRKLLLKDIATQLLSGKSKQAFQTLAEYMGVDPDRIDVETALHLKQMEKALKKGDTAAYNAVMDRIKGKPVQEVRMNTAKIKPMKLIDATSNRNTSA